VELVRRLYAVEDQAKAKRHGIAFPPTATMDELREIIADAVDPRPSAELRAEAERWGLVVGPGWRTSGTEEQIEAAKVADKKRRNYALHKVGTRDGG
jgi:hypothetical protein